MKSKKLIAAHIHQKFFVRSETFIYHYLNNFIDFKPVCLAPEFVNLELFPFEKNNLWNIGYPIQRLKKILKNDRDYPLSWNLSKAERLLKKNKVALIHAHFGPNAFQALALKERVDIPLVTTFYGYDMSMLPRHKEWRTRYQELFKKGDLFLVEGNYMKERLCELGCPQNKIKIQRIAIPLTNLFFRERLPKIDNEKTILIFCGRFVEKKGLEYAFMALEQVKNKFDNFEFWVIGDGPLRKKIENQVKDLKLQNFVKMLGFLSYNEYLDKMSKADIFLHPSILDSLGDSEGGAPTTILEAQALGMPIISTFHADIPNVTLPGQSALLSPEREVGPLADNIYSLLVNQKSWGKFGKAGRDFVCKWHNIENEIKNLELIYFSLTNN